MTPEPTSIDQNFPLFEHRDASRQEGLRILTGEPVWTSSPVHSAPTKAIPINNGHHLFHSLSPSPSPQPRASSYNGMDTAGTSPAMAFLSSFGSSPSIPPRPLEEDSVAGYSLGETVGYGGFSTIRKAYSTSGGVVAVKVVPRGAISKGPNPAQARKRLDYERQIWSSLSHEHILPLFADVQTDYADYFVTLYCPAGSLFDILRRDGRPALAQDDAGMMFRQVIKGLRYLHESAFLVHRDIKLENILVDDMGVCRIGDFGLAKRIGEPQVDLDEELLSIDGLPMTTAESLDTASASLTRASSLAMPNRRQTGRTGGLHTSLIRTSTTKQRTPTTILTPPAQASFPPGSLPYAAPELLVPQHSSGPLIVDPAQDLWALGVTLYALLTGRLPFSDPFEPRLHMKILQGTHSYVYESLHVLTHLF